MARKLFSLSDDHHSMATSSKTQHIINSANSEVKRRMARINNFSPTNRQNEYTRNGDKNIDHAIPGSIMTVRTLKDSLFYMEDAGKNIYRAKRKCSLSRRKMNGLIKEISDSNSNTSLTCNQSNFESLSNTSFDSFENFDVKFGTVSIREYMIEPGDNPG